MFSEEIAWNDLLRSLRRAGGFTQAEWSALISAAAKPGSRAAWSTDSVARWERGDHPPNADTADAIATVCREKRLFDASGIGESLLRAKLAQANVRVGQARASRSSGEAWPAAEIGDASDRVGVGRQPPEAGSLASRGVVAGLAGAVRFVGREPELAELTHQLDAASGGPGGIVLVAGEPGIGKTRLVLEVADRGRTQGWEVLFGRAYESGGMPPYLPLVEALRAYVWTCPLDQLRGQLGVGAAEVGLLVREVRARLPDLPSSPPLSPEEERHRLFEGVSDFLLNIARASPRGLLLCLDDLHWADKPTLLLVQHLARKLADAPLLVVGTYRTVELDRTHPLSDVLAELSREHLYQRMLLSSFSADEAGDFVQERNGGPAAPAVAAAIYRETEGNPFFMEELVRHLRAEKWDLADPSVVVADWGIPEGVRQVVGKRLSRLSPEANRLLQAGAVLGEGFSFEVLGAVSELEHSGTREPAALARHASPLLDALEEALGAGLLREEAQDYHFTHALVRQTIEAELSLPRKQRLHLQAAEAIERIHARNPEPHAAELAYHFFRAARGGVADKAVTYARRAGERAQTVFAYEEAVRFHAMALKALDLTDAPDPAQRCDLLLALGEAQMPLGEPRGVADGVASEAFGLAEGLGDRGRASRACRMVLEALHRDAPRNTDTPQWRAWADLADRHAEPETPDRAYADIAMARAAIAAGDQGRAVDLLERALGLARHLDDPELLCTCAWQLMWAGYTPQHWRRSVAIAEEFLDWPRERVRSRTIGQVLEFCGLMLLANGDRAGVERAWGELSQLAARARDAFNQLNAMSYEAVLATLDGRLHEAAEIGRRMMALGEKLGMERAAAYFALTRCGRALLYLGQADELESLNRAGGPLISQTAFVHAYTGRRTESQAMVRAWLAEHPPDAGTPVDYLSNLARFLETALILEDRDAAAILAQWLVDAPPVQAAGFATCFARHVGAAAALNGDRARARDHYQAALKVATLLHYRPEVALTRLQLAELLLDEAFARERRSPSRREKEQRQAEGLEHLDFAIDELRAMNMKPALERALQVRGGQQPVTPHPDRSARFRAAYPAGLSERELDVLRLIAAGKSNQRIADELVISLNTVIRHVSNIFAKTGVANRVEAATYATRHGLA